MVSHLGSGSEIWVRRIDDALAGAETPDDLAPSVWSRWDAKSPRAKADDGLAAAQALMKKLDAVSAVERERFALDMGPIDLDWDAFVGLRLNEHLLHEWDVAVTFDQSATLGRDGVDHAVDNLAMVAGWTAKPSGHPRVVVVETTDPDRAFTVDIGSEAVGFTSGGTGAAGGEPTLTMPAEAFVRLVYGRLDADHTPSSVTGDADALAQLRTVFRGP